MANDNSSVKLPLAILNIILRLLMDIQGDNFLNQCLDGKKENPNEAVNKINWKYPKETFVSK